jgi:chemotaxis protein CheX
MSKKNPEIHEPEIDGIDMELVSPFIESARNVLITMAKIEPLVGKPHPKLHAESMGDVSGFIGLTGKKLKGSLAVSFTGEAIINVASIMLDEAVHELDETVADLVGEITNIITGGAKRLLAEKGYKFDLSVPTTIIGKGHFISHKTKGWVVVVPIDIPKGNLFLELCFEK